MRNNYYLFILILHSQLDLWFIDLVGLRNILYFYIDISQSQTRKG
jgi:hypothetical protein